MGTPLSARETDPVAFPLSVRDTPGAPRLAVASHSLFCWIPRPGASPGIAASCRLAPPPAGHGPRCSALPVTTQTTRSYRADAPAGAKIDRSTHPSPLTLTQCWSDREELSHRNGRLAEVLPWQTPGGAIDRQQTLQPRQQGVAPSKYHNLLPFVPLCRYISMPSATEFSRFSKFEPWTMPCPVHARPAATAPKNSSL